MKRMNGIWLTVFSCKRVEFGVFTSYFGGCGKTFVRQKRQTQKLLLDRDTRLPQKLIFEHKHIHSSQLCCYQDVPLFLERLTLTIFLSVRM